MRVRVASWNVAYRVRAAQTQGAWLASLRPCPSLVLLQEVNPHSIEVLCAAAGLTWSRLAVDLRAPEAGDRPVRRRGVAIAGRSPEPSEVMILPDLPLPERTLMCRLPLVGTDAFVASYHAPPGVSWREKKPQQAVGFARWLATIQGPVLFGADANTPVVDAIDFAMSRTHWHTGSRKLHGAPGDDVLVGPAKLHNLDDALRRWLSDHPKAAAEIFRARPTGPLRTSYTSGKRRMSPGYPQRFDSIWVSRHFRVIDVDYPYESCLAAGSDHAAVIVDLELSSECRTPRPARSLTAGQARH
jgi:hypothetical protein